MGAIGYARVSKPNKGRPDSLSIEVQRAAIEAAAQANGWDLIDIKVDEGKSGSHTRREGLSEALSVVGAGQADMLIVAKFDRLSRDARYWLDLLFDSSKQGWAISVLNDRLDSSTATGWLHCAIRAVFAEYERRLIGERTRDALAVLKANGKELGQASPISSAVRRKVTRWHNDGLSASEIARRLSADPKTPTPSGKDWHHSVVTRLLKRERGSHHE